MRILAISEFYPKFDRASGDLRYFQLLKSLAESHEMSIWAYDAQYEVRTVSEEDTQRYRQALEGLGVRVLQGGVAPVLKSAAYDLVIFEYYFAAQRWFDQVRFLLPRARIIIDSVDIVFRRMISKAEVTGSAADHIAAERVKQEELAIYARADGIITVSPEDDVVLHAVLPNVRSFIIPNIHSMPAQSPIEARSRHSLVFVGAFPHQPNVDAMLYFCAEIFPLITRELPDVRLTVIGYDPPPAIQALASESIEVLGFVPDTRPYLERAAVSIAPLRFGAGIKGKIGEAMSYALPVVTTSVGAEGFGLVPGEHLLVADTPEEFATAVLRLMRDDALYRGIASAGRTFIETRYSEVAVAQRVRDFAESAAGLEVHHLELFRLLRMSARQWLQENLLWRFG